MFRDHRGVRIRLSQMDPNLSFGQKVLTEVGFVTLVAARPVASIFTTDPAVVSVVTLGLVPLPAAWIGSSAIGSAGLWIAFTISNAVGAIVAYCWLKRGT